MTDETTWAIERDKAYELFGGSIAYDSDDQEIAAVFAQHPAAVIAEIARIADAYANGKIHTPWRALHSRLAKIERDAQPVSITRDLRVLQAENWIRNAGLYCPTEDEVIDELFSSHGLLAGQEAAFGDRMLDLWRAELPRAERAEADRVARAEQWRQGQEALTGSKPSSTYVPITLPEDAGPPDPDDWSDQ